MNRNELLKRNQDRLAKARRDDLFAEFLTPFDRLFDDFFKTVPAFQNKYGIDFFEKGSYPKVDILDTETAITIEAAVPGLSKDSISVDVYDGVLTISGEKQETVEKGNSYLYRELKRSSFRRSWTLGDNLDQDNISAKFEDGMLYLTIPKLEAQKAEETPRKIAIG